MNSQPDREQPTEHIPSWVAATKPQPPGWFVGVLFFGFLGWCWYYLFVLRPELNQWLANYISEYPAMLHLIPLIGAPALVAACVGPLVSKPRHKP